MKKILTSVFTIMLFIILFPRLVVAQVNTENMRRGDLAEGLHNALNFDFGLVTGNSEFLNLEAGFRTDYVSDNYYTFGVLQYQRKLQNDKAFINKGFLHLRGIRRLARRFCWELFVQKEFNDFILLKNRILFGSGLRIILLSAGSSSGGDSPVDLYAGVGVMWENEEVDTSPPSDDKMVRSTNYLSFSWRIDERMYLGAVSYYQFQVDDPQDYRILLETGFGFDITRSFSFRMSFNLRYDNEPPQKVKRHDLELKNGLQFVF
jgi:hypothetical protein